jgi:lia operon protein LiaF
MSKQTRMLVGLAFIVAGLMFLAGVVLRINVWTFCWPIGLIALGAWLLLRPSLASPGTRVRVHPLADVKRKGAWDVVNEEIWIFVGDVHLDFTQASLSPGESKIKLFGLVGEVTLVVPEGLPVSASSAAFLTDGTVYGEKQEQFVTVVQVEDDAYDSAAAKVKVESVFLVNTLKVKRPQ